MLEGPLPAWDIERRSGDVAPINEWVHEEARKRGTQLASLELAHQALTASEALAFAQHLTQASRQRPMRTALHELLRRALPALPWQHFVVQATAHFRILIPGDAIAPVPLHTDFGIGHPLDERNVWIALTPARKTSALRLLSLDRSRNFEHARVREGALLIKDAPALPIDVDRGELLLFTPLHVHGAALVGEPETRISIDVRIAPKERALARAPTLYVELEDAA